MKHDKRLFWVGLVALVLVLMAVVGTASQGPGNDQGETALDTGIEGQEAIILAQPPYAINYQGYLTDSSGNPLDGLYDLVFRLYDDPAADVYPEWGPETHPGVQVTDGLFQVALGTSVTLYPHDFDKALFLAVQVDGTDVTPRQPLRPVPYAFGLVPGAEVEGDPIGTDYGLWVQNTGTEERDAGIRAVGERYGIFAEEVGDGDVGIFSPDYVRAQGFRSSDASHLWVPGTASVLYPTSGCTLYNQVYGSARLYCTSSGSRTIDLPITVPGVLFGQNVHVEGIRVHYDLDHADSYISRTRLHKLTDAGRSDVLIDDATDRQSTSPDSYWLEPTGNYTLTATAGALNLRLTIVHDGNVDHDVTVGGVRVRLRHHD